MARLLCALVLAGVFAGPAVSATRPVAVIASPYPLVCGQATGLIKVAFTPTVRVPRTIARAAVTVNGRTPSSVKVGGRTVSVTVARKPGITCLSIVMGRLTIVFAPRAGLDVGTAGVAAVSHGTQVYKARISA